MKEQKRKITSFFVAMLMVLTTVLPSICTYAAEVGKPDVEAEVEGVVLDQIEENTEDLKEDSGSPNLLMNFDDDSNMKTYRANEEASHEIDKTYGLYSEYDGQDSMNDMNTAGSSVGWDISTRSAIQGDSELWWIDDYYIGESDKYSTHKTDDFTIKYQIEFHSSEDLDIGSVQITLNPVLGKYRNGNNILPTDIGIPYGTPETDDSWVKSSSSPFNYYYIDSNNNILAESEAKTADSVTMAVWNYRRIESGSNAMFQVLYSNLDCMQIYDGTVWNIDVSANVDLVTEGETVPHTETVDGNTLIGDLDTQVLLTSVSKKAYHSGTINYTPELYTKSQVNSYMSNVLEDPWASHFEDYIYIVWQVSFRGSATQAYNFTLDSENTFGETTQGTIIGYKASGGSVTGSVEDGTLSITYSQSTSRSFNNSFYVVTAYDKDTYEMGSYLENDVTITAHPADGLDEDITKSASDQTTWGEYNWTYKGDIIGIEKNGGGTFSAHLNLYEINSANGKDTGEYSFSTKSTDRGFGFTHYTSGENMGDYIPGTYYTTTTVDDALYLYPNGGTSPARMLGKEDYYFSSVKITTTDNGYDVWEDKTAGAFEYDGVDQSVYVYAMYYDEAGDADDDGWEYVGSVPFSTSGTMTYTFSSSDLARQPYRIKAVHSTGGYATYCTIALGVTLRGDSPVIQKYIEEYGDDLSSLKIENISGAAGQAYGQDARSDTVYVKGEVYHDGDYFQDTGIENGNYSEKDTETGRTLVEFTQALYNTILMRDNAYATLTSLTETANATKNLTTEKDTANARMLVNYTLTAYEGYNVTGSSAVDALKTDGISLPKRNEVSFYDLLPYGMQYNASAAVTVGRITAMSGSWTTNSGAWNKNGVSVSVEEDDIITNWNGTGRTMVIFHIAYDGADASEYQSEKWYQGFGVAFQAYYSWTDINSVDAEYNIAAYIPENVKDDSQQLLGEHDSSVWKDDGSFNLSSQYDPFKVEDLNGDGETGFYTNMYASAKTQTNVATSSNDYIKKAVRADKDAVAEFGSTASVDAGGSYTYQITLTNGTGAALSDIVLFDRLENAVEDGRDEVETSNESVFYGLSDEDIHDNWKGNFLGVIATALEDAGIAPVIYYNASRNAVISGEDGYPSPSDILTEQNGWYESSVYSGNLSDVKAVAVDASKKMNGNDFTLDEESSISFRIRMQAPDEKTYNYAFNNPSYYSVSTDTTGDITKATDSGDTVRVELGKTGILEVEKEYRNPDQVPGSVFNQKFIFTVNRCGKPLANQEYMLHNWNNDTQKFVSTGVVKSTDINGQLILKAGQKAVFSDVVDLDQVEVTEEANLMWASEMTVDDSLMEDNDNPVLSYLFTNAYRSPVYLQKKVETTDLASDAELENAEFTFTIYVDTNGDGNYTPYSDGEYIYVQKALTDGSSPDVDRSKGDNGYGYADENGNVMLSIGDIIAFYPCDERGIFENRCGTFGRNVSSYWWNEYALCHCSTSRTSGPCLIYRS